MAGTLAETKLHRAKKNKRKITPSRCETTKEKFGYQIYLLVACCFLLLLPTDTVR